MPPLVSPRPLRPKGWHTYADFETILEQNPDSAEAKKALEETVTLNGAAISGGADYRARGADFSLFADLAVDRHAGMAVAGNDLAGGFFMEEGLHGFHAVLAGGQAFRAEQQDLRSKQKNDWDEILPWERE